MASNQLLFDISAGARAFCHGGARGGAAAVLRDRRGAGRPVPVQPEGEADGPGSVGRLPVRKPAPRVDPAAGEARARIWGLTNSEIGFIESGNFNLGVELPGFGQSRGSF